MNDLKRILVTGATGYVGGQLISPLLERGYEVTVLVRDDGKLSGSEWLNRVRVVTGDVLDRTTLKPALSGIDAAYYMIHSMTGGKDFAEQDLVAAENFGVEAKKAGVKRVLYLGGLGDENCGLSEHLRSRHDTGERLRQTGVSTTEFRAAIIVGAGSISFEMIRYLAERVPIMICPRWVRTRVQPIAVEDVISYLIEALRRPETADRIIEIGGSDVLTYGDMMTGYARVRGLRRRLINVPVLTPRLSSYWVHWVTPVKASYARPLIDGLRSEVIVKDDAAKKLFPDIRPLDYSSAVSRALSQLHPDFSASDPAVCNRQTSSCIKMMSNGLASEVRCRFVDCPPEAVYSAFVKLGGSRGWPCNLAWRVRACIDSILGGIGMRRGSPQGRDLQIGDTVDFFRVVDIEPNRMLRLKAEMRLPGDGWLQLDVEPTADDRSRLAVRVFFAPKGLFGLLYWNLVKGFHAIIFRRLTERLAADAMENNLGR